VKGYLLLLNKETDGNLHTHISTCLKVCLCCLVKGVRVYVSIVC